MNNKGFAITTILFGILILFLLLLVSLLNLLALYKGNMEKLIDATNGTRDILTITPNREFGTKAELHDYLFPGEDWEESTVTFERLSPGLYCFSDETVDKCKYYSVKELFNINNE